MVINMATATAAATSTTMTTVNTLTKKYQRKIVSAEGGVNVDNDCVAFDQPENYGFVQGDADATGCAGTTLTTITTTPTVKDTKEPEMLSNAQVPTSVTATTTTTTAVLGVGFNKNLLLCRRFKDMGSGCFLRNFNSLPLFVYATSSSTHATSADGVGVGREAAAAAATKNDAHEYAHDTNNLMANRNGSNGCGDEEYGSTSNPNSRFRAGFGNSVMECLPLNSSSAVNTHVMSTTASGSGVGVLPSAVVVGAASGVTYPHHLNLNHHHHHHHLLSHHSPYSNNYPLHHSSSHHHIHSDQTKSLQELQHEVGALLEFRDLVIETFPDLKHKMASMSSSTASSTAMLIGNVGGGSVNHASVSVTNTSTTSGGMSSTSLASRREWEPGIRMKRKLSHKEPSTTATSASTVTTVAPATGSSVAGTELSSSSLTRSRSNSHSGKKEPKSGENNNGSVVQDSGFSTETSSSKEGHSASSTNGAMTTVAIASNRLSYPESDDELLNLLDVIHRKSNRLREEMEHLQNYERQQLRSDVTRVVNNNESDSTATVNKSSSNSNGLTPKTFREHVERLNKEDIKQLRKERDRLLDKLAEMEAETLTGRIKAAKMNDKVEELISVKKDLEEQLKLAMAQKLELSSRVQQLQLQQQQQLQSKSSSSSQSDYSSQRNFLSSATTVLSTGSTASQQIDNTQQPHPRRQNTFQPVIIEQQQATTSTAKAAFDEHLGFHQSAGSDNKQQEQHQQLGRLDGIVSTPGARNTKCRATDSKRFAAILLESNPLELQRHLLTLTVQHQALSQKLESSKKSETHLAKRLDKSKEVEEDLRFQLEEKNIELEGTKALLRVQETRMRSTTPSTTNSYLNSQNDYETNRSSASTTLMLSRRGVDSNFSGGDLRSQTPISTVSAQAMPPPTSTQISTPSMKAMVHLPMDEIQHQSSSTESAHEHEMLPSDLLDKRHQMQQQRTTTIGRLMSTSVGGISPFEHAQRGQQHAFKKYGSSVSKPSKIPLPGSKAAAYFGGKPPTGRPSTAGRSPPSVNTSTTSYGSSKSSLSRSTGNLLYSKSPNSLKSADSAQSIGRKDASNNSLSTNTSRSSTSSSIPLATTPYSSNASHSNTHRTQTATTPSPRALQNSPLPKLKRESLTSRVRQLDSLSRVQQHKTTLASSTHLGDVTTNSPNAYIVSSTPKPSSISTQLNTPLRKDLQLNPGSNFATQQQYMRRSTAVASATNDRSQNAARRFSSSANASTTRLIAREQSSNTAASDQQPLNNSTISGSGSGAHVASDSDSGKVRTLKSAFLGWLKI